MPSFYNKKTPQKTFERNLFKESKRSNVTFDVIFGFLVPENVRKKYLP